MSVRVAVDGYNLIGLTSGIGKGVDIEDARRRLIDRLVTYKRNRSKGRVFRLAVVFDGTESGRWERTRQVDRGIEIIFSRSGEKADDVLKEMAREKREGLTLVTSDREVADYAKGRGAVVISSGEFEGLLEMAEYVSLKGIDVEAEDEETPYRGSEKKGPSRRLSKEERRRLKRIKKL